MYAELPETIKRMVTEYLLADDFRTAKQIHDDWVRQHKNAKQSNAEFA